MNTLMTVLLVLCALGSGAIGGVFFAFSNFVMPALARIAPAEGIHAMQAINVTVLNRLFLGTFMGTGLLSLATIVGALLPWHDTSSTCAVLAGAIYLLGSILVTMRGNVPLNNALMRIAQADALGEAIWNNYLRDWTRWNHVRTVACFAAMTLYIVALMFFTYESAPIHCFDMICRLSPDAETN
ncbi:MAG TPA: anthrone oxygenase family protein [Dongiaceae bacterium]|nr:anthrone oxygenase family protein [Dongiaceae bacterium]